MLIKKKEQDSFDYLSKLDNLQKEAILTKERNKYSMPVLNIIIEIKKFYLDILNGGIISLTSSNLGKYRKGWLLAKDNIWKELNK